MGERVIIAYTTKWPIETARKRVGRITQMLLITSHIFPAIMLALYDLISYSVCFAIHGQIALLNLQNTSICFVVF